MGVWEAGAVDSELGAVGRWLGARTRALWVEGCWSEVRGRGLGFASWGQRQK